MKYQRGKIYLRTSNGIRLILELFQDVMPYLPFESYSPKYVQIQCLILATDIEVRYGLPNIKEVLNEEIKEVPRTDLPLYIGWGRPTPYFEKVLKGCAVTVPPYDPQRIYRIIKKEDLI